MTGESTNLTANNFGKLDNARFTPGDKQAGRVFIKNRINIDERPHVVDDKSRMSDWEIDLVIGNGHDCRAQNEFYRFDTCR
jgi:IS30 family transposase